MRSLVQYWLWPAELCARCRAGYREASVRSTERDVVTRRPHTKDQRPEHAWSAHRLPAQDCLVACQTLTEDTEPSVSAQEINPVTHDICSSRRLLKFKLTGLWSVVFRSPKCCVRVIAKMAHSHNFYVLLTLNCFRRYVKCITVLITSCPK